MKTNVDYQGRKSVNEKRAYLKALSQPLRALKKEGVIDTINEGLIAVYAEQGHTELKTIQQWNKAGFRVKKGESALLLWGNKKQRGKKENEDAEKDDNFEFFPLCYVFSNLQIQAEQ